MHHPCPIMALLPAPAPAPPHDPGPWSQLGPIYREQKPVGGGCWVLGAGMGALQWEDSPSTPWPWARGQLPPRMGSPGAPAASPGAGARPRPGQRHGEAHVAAAPACPRWPQNPIAAPSAWVTLVARVQRDREQVPPGTPSRVGCAANLLPRKGPFRPPSAEGTGGQGGIWPLQGTLVGGRGDTGSGETPRALREVPQAPRPQCPWAAPRMVELVAPAPDWPSGLTPTPVQQRSWDLVARVSCVTRDGCPCGSGVPCQASRPFWWHPRTMGALCQYLGGPQGQLGQIQASHPHWGSRSPALPRRHGGPHPRD